MDAYLKQHPDIFMAKKSLDFFGSDLPFKRKDTESEYLKNFTLNESKKIIGESSVLYLYSKKAAKEIYEFNPDSNILIMLRNPVKLLTSLHSQHLCDGNEDVADFEKAILLDDERRKGNMQPKCVDFTSLPPYKDIALFSEQVKRYLDVFGEKKVFILIYEEFAENPKAATKSVLDFLGVDSNLDIEYPIINPNKRIRFLFFHRFMKMPSGWIRKFFRIIIPAKKIRHRIMLFFQERNLVVKERPTLNPQIEKELKEEFSADIEKLEKIIDRKLTFWH